MCLQVNNKRAVSIMIGYVLLVVVAVVLSIIVYQWIKSYTPKEALACPDDVSIHIKEYWCNSDYLNITIKNNGKFNIAGYFIRVSNSSGQEIATIDLSSRLLTGGEITGNSVLFEQSGENTLKPGEETSQKYNIAGLGSLYLIEIIPVRYQEEENKMRFVSCGEEKIKEDIECIG